MSSRASYLLIEGASVWRPEGKFAPASILVGDGRILEVGPPSTFVGIDIPVVTAERAFVIPGFVDAHTHLMALALVDLRCDLSAAQSAADVVAQLASYAARADHDDVIVGIDWDESAWHGRAFPTRAALDAAFPDRPVYARRVCCHVGVINTAFLKKFELVDSVHGAVDADTGTITEEAVFAANRMTRPRGGSVVSGMPSAVSRLHALGITTIHDIVEPDGYDDYLAGLLASAPLRVDALFTCPVEALDGIRARTADLAANVFRCAGIKRFADGSFGGRTAALNAPYADADTRGDVLIDPEALKADIAACAERDIVCAVHAIGDRALDEVVDVMLPFVQSGAKLRIEHAELVSDAAIAKLRAAPIPLVMQPNFVRNWAGMDGLYERRLGSERWARNNPFRTLAANGIPVVFSSDGMPPGPLFGIRGATHHAVPGERIDVRSAIERYTVVAHRIPGHDRPAGAVAPGQWADLVVLPANPLLADLDSLSVDMTLVGGKIVYRRAGENA